MAHTIWAKLYAEMFDSSNMTSYTGGEADINNYYNDCDSDKENNDEDYLLNIEGC